jgi:hypothetical protein
VFLKGQAHSLSHEKIGPVLCFPLPHTTKQLRAFLGVTGFYRIWNPRYAVLARLLFMLFLIFLFGSYIINALSRFISQQVQQIKLQLLVKKYSPLPTHELSIPFYFGGRGGGWRLHRSTPETSTLSPIPQSPIFSMKYLDESSPLSPIAVGCLSQRGDLLGLDT